MTDKKEKIQTSIVVSLLFGLTVFLFGPVQIYYTNNLEFEFIFTNVVYFIVLLTLFLIVCLILLLTALKTSVHEKVASFLFIFATLWWIQGNILILIRDYGIFDGKEINWNDHTIFSLFDLLLWIVLLSLALIKTRTVYKLIRAGGISLIIIQSISSLITWYQAPEEPDWKRYYIETESNFNYSSDKNVIILLLDTFQSDIFQEILNEEPSLHNDFNGFTYFRNSLGGFPYTYPSVPLILTGEYYDNSVPIQEFIQNSYSTKSIPLILNKHGYDIALFPYITKTIYLNEKISSNIQVKKTEYSANNLLELYNVTFFRYLPDITKKYFYRYKVNSDDKESNSIGYRDLDFIHSALRDSRVENSKPTFKFFHLVGAHPPFQLNEQLKIEKLPFNRDGYKIQAKAELEIVRRFLASLKDLGVYDNSMIMVVGDHGLGSHGINYNGEIIYNSMIASAIPLILVKPFGADGILKTSDAPVTLSDIPKTIFDELGIEDDYPGVSMFRLNETDNRERRFLYFNWVWEDWDKAFLPPMREYIVTGFSWDEKYWTPTYRRYTSSSVEKITLPYYQFGSQIHFGKGGNSKEYEELGWSNGETGYTWTDGKMASLVFFVSAANSNLLLSADFTPYVSDIIKQQKINVIVNGKHLGAWIATESGKYQLTIPKELVTESILNIKFELPDAISPAELNIGDDQRMVGIAMRSIVITELPIYQYGTTLQFGIGGNAQDFLEKGWSAAEQGITWTDGKKASLLLSVPPTSSDLVLSSILIPHVSSKVTKQQVNIYVNGQKIGEWNATKEGEYSIKIPKELVTTSILKLEFELPDSISPAKLGTGSDLRELGIAMISLKISNE
mgnify:CR=1 FL=1